MRTALESQGRVSVSTIRRYLTGAPVLPLVKDYLDKATATVKPVASPVAVHRPSVVRIEGPDGKLVS
jgi:hypothetical protein